MRPIEHIFFLRTRHSKERGWQRYVLDALLAIVAASAVTTIIYLLKWYPAIPNISFLYLLVVLGLSSTRGLYAAIIASIVAFMSFDYYLVPPLFTLTVIRFEEWLALFILLITAIITGQLASALRGRAEESTQREHDTRVLYDLVSATTSEENPQRQLDIVAHAIVDNFSTAGVHDCAILLPDSNGKLTLQADACQPVAQMQLSADEEKTAASVMAQRRIIDLYNNHPSPAVSGSDAQYRFKRIIGGERPGAMKDGGKQQYVRLIPLQVGQRSVGVVHLLMDEASGRIPVERHIEPELSQQTAFFWTFLDQAASVIERERLRREALDIEVLRRTDALRAALLSSVSHDLRTPLSSIKAAASSLLQEDVQWDEETRRSFALAIEREADRLNRLVGNLLDMTRIEGGALKPEKELYPIEELIHDVVSRMQGLLQKREVQLSLPDDLPPVELDYLQIDQVLTNLLENAVRYTPAGTPISISARVADKQIMVSITDRGPGIPSQALERIFDKFYRVSGASRRDMGSGLGLAVCRGLIEAHGGHIWAENQPEGGATFRFTLPLSIIEEGTGVIDQPASS